MPDFRDPMKQAIDAAFTEAIDAPDAAGEVDQFLAELERQGYIVASAKLRRATVWLLSMVEDWIRWSEDPERGPAPSQSTGAVYLDQLLEEVGLIEPATTILVCLVCQVVPFDGKPACRCPGGPTYAVHEAADSGDRSGR